jgi:hypothetical protein
LWRRRNNLVRFYGEKRKRKILRFEKEKLKISQMRDGKLNVEQERKGEDRG